MGEHALGVGSAQLGKAQKAKQRMANWLIWQTGSYGKLAYGKLE